MDEANREEDCWLSLFCRVRLRPGHQVSSELEIFLYEFEAKTTIGTGLLSSLFAYRTQCNAMQCNAKCESRIDLLTTHRRISVLQKPRGEAATMPPLHIIISISYSPRRSPQLNGSKCQKRFASLWLCVSFWHLWSMQTSRTPTFHFLSSGWDESNPNPNHSLLPPK